MPAHSALTGASLHIVRGADTANLGQTLLADGAGDASFANVNNSNLVFIVHHIETISTASSSFVVPAIAGTITGIKTVISGAITGANATLTFFIDGVAITGSSITITQVGSAARDVDSSTPSGANVITANSVITMTTNGASTGAVRATITFIIDVT